MGIHILCTRKQISVLLNQSHRAIDAYREQNFDQGLRNTRSVIEGLSALIQELLTQKDDYAEFGVEINSEAILSIVQDLVAVQETKDYILMADLLELQLNPWLIHLQECITSIDEESIDPKFFERNCRAIEEQDKELAKLLRSEQRSKREDPSFRLENTSVGELTLHMQNDEEGIYFHSNISPSNEGLQLAKSFIQEGKTEYVIYGLGLGYAALSLCEIDEYANVIVYESNLQVIYLACTVQDFSELTLSGRLSIIYDPFFILLNDRLKLEQENDQSVFVVHYPSIRAIKDLQVRNSIEDYFLQYSSVKNQLPRLIGNFRMNIAREDQTVDDLRDRFTGADLYIIAAGPSLDGNFMHLKEVREEAIKRGRKALFVATGTVYRKLIQAGIHLDYVIVTDANPRVYAQIRGLESEMVPMLYLSTAYYLFAKNYKAEKYVILQQDFALAEEYAMQFNRTLFQTGGSVSTTALDLGIRFNCERIIFLGLDLSYPNKLMHASNTSRRELVDIKGLRETTDINGEMIYTSKSMDIYRKWIEERIVQARNEGYSGEIIDATEGGVRIQGMKLMRLLDERA